MIARASLCAMARSCYARWSAGAIRAAARRRSVAGRPRRTARAPRPAGASRVAGLHLASAVCEHARAIRVSLTVVPSAVGIRGGKGARLMGRIVYAAAMSHVLYPDYYGKNVGPHGRKMVEALIDVVRDMGRDMLAARPDALIVIADDHLNVFSFDAVPAFCVRTGHWVDRMAQDDAIEFDQALDGLPARYPLHERLANRVLEDGIDAGFDLAASWAAPLDHAFLSPVTTLCGDRSAPPL